MKKTTLKITMAFLLAVCTLTGCGNSSSSDKKSDKKDKAETTTVAEDTTEKTTEEKTDEKTDEKTTEAEEEKTTANDSPSAAEGTDFKRGVVENNVYTNEFAGFKLNLTDDWKFLDDEMINQVVNVGAGATGSSNSEALADYVNMTTITDAICMNSKTNESVTITFENLNKNIMLSTDTTPEEYLEIANRQFAALPSMKYTQTGDTTTVEIGGNEYIRALYDVEYNSLKYKQSYYIRRIGDFMNVMAVVSYNADEDLTAFESNFSALD